MFSCCPLFIWSILQSRWKKVNIRQNCTTPPNHWDFGIWLGWMSISWDPSQLHAIPNPDHPPLRICLTYQLFCTKKKCPWAFKSSYNIEIWLNVLNFSFSLFWLRFSSGQSRTLIQGRGTREETHWHIDTLRCIDVISGKSK